MRMREPAQEAALPLESLLAAAAHQSDVQKLDRYAAVESPVTALPEPYATHSSLSDRRYEPVRADGSACNYLRNRSYRALLQEAFLCQKAMLIQEIFQKGCNS